jgi:hypothetical protein
LEINNTGHHLYYPTTKLLNKHKKEIEREERKTGVGQTRVTTKYIL